MAKKGKQRVEIPPRPTIKTEGIEQSGVLAFCREFKKYDAAQLLEVWCYPGDGYRLARSLELYGLHPTEETVIELSQLNSHVHDALIVAEKQWVKENNVRLHIQEGQQVAFLLAEKNTTGVVVGTDPARAIYYVRADGDISESKYSIYAERVTVMADSCSGGNHKAWPCPACGLGPCMQAIDK